MTLTRRRAAHARTMTGLLVLLGCLLLPWPPVVRATPPADGDVRGLWVLRSTLTSEAGIDRLVADANANGFNTLLVQVRGRGDAYFASALEPRAAELANDPDAFDPLAVTIARAHAAGLRVHAWVNVNLVASAARPPDDPGHVAVKHPEWLMVPKTLAAELAGRGARAPDYIGRLARWTTQHAAQVEGLFLSPLVPAAQAYTVDVLTDLARRYPIDGLHLDYIRFPGPEFDYSPAALAAFRDAAAWDVPIETAARLDAESAASPTAWPDAMPDAWEAFRHERLTDLVARIAQGARAARPGVVLSAAVLPDPAEALARKRQDWSGWADAGYLDVICPMIYTTSPDSFVQQLDAVVAAAGGAPVWAGIGAFRLPVTRTAANIRNARRGGARGVLLFSYDSLVSASAPSRGYLRALRPALLEGQAPAAGRR